MTVSHVEVLVEEPSMEAALGALLPKMLGKTSFQVYVHNGKTDLLASLPGRLRGYAAWMTADYRILVVSTATPTTAWSSSGRLRRPRAVLGCLPERRR
ncbi:MAG: hypothetical protein ACRENE_01410 [Polyangiaceae bacterium]